MAPSAVVRPTALALLAVLFCAATCKGSGGDRASTPTPAPPAAPAAPSAADRPPAPAPGEAGKAALVLGDIPGMDFSQLSPAAQRELATVFADEFCYCGCPHSLGACLKTHATCKHARRMATLAAASAASGSPATEIIVELSKYYRSFRDKRAALKPDPRLCEGKADAALTVVQFSAFDCPYCEAARPVFTQLAKARPDARVCFMPFPLAGHAASVPAAQAAMLARDKGKFREMHDALFDNQASLSAQTIPDLAGKIGLNAAEVRKALETGKYLDEVNASKEAGRAAGVDATPTVFVNGRKFQLALTPATLSHTLDDEVEWMAGRSAWASD